MKTCFQIHKDDNVAALLVDAGPEEITVTGAGQGRIFLSQAIVMGHKAAVRPIAAGESIIKFGIPIGRATRDIAPGEWVHLHNCASFVDERSSSMDLQTGVPSDIRYE
jgi:altronate dehydratase small subunit